MVDDGDPFEWCLALVGHAGLINRMGGGLSSGGVDCGLSRLIANGRRVRQDRGLPYEALGEDIIAGNRNGRDGGDAKGSGVGSGDAAGTGDAGGAGGVTRADTGDISGCGGFSGCQPGGIAGAGCQWTGAGWEWDDAGDKWNIAGDKWDHA